jgi:TPR repeat protein
VKADAAEGRRWLAESARRGHTPSMLYLANLLAAGEKLPKDTREALRLYEEALLLGDRQADDDRAEAIDEGWVPPSQAQVSFNRLLRAAQGGNLEAMASVGADFVDGRGTEPNPVEGMAWLRKAANGGSVLGQRSLGWALYHAIGVSKDRAQAIQWWRKSAAAGDVPSLHHLGRGLLETAVPGAEPRDAIGYLETAARAGFTQAAMLLADMYDRGYWGVSKDPRQARTWYELAAEQGNTEAKGWLRFRELSGGKP